MQTFCTQIVQPPHDLSHTRVVCVAPAWKRTFGKNPEVLTYDWMKSGGRSRQ
jgi:hypothetical protein